MNAFVFSWIDDNISRWPVARKRSGDQIECFSCGKKVRLVDDEDNYDPGSTSTEICENKTNDTH